MITSSITKKYLKDQEEHFQKRSDELVLVFKAAMEIFNNRPYEEVEKMFYLPVKFRINLMAGDADIWDAKASRGYEIIKRQFIDIDGNFDRERFLYLKNQYLESKKSKVAKYNNNPTMLWKQDFGPYNEVDEGLTKVLNHNDNICNTFEVQINKKDEYDIIVNNYSLEYGLSLSLIICGTHPLITDRELWLDKPGYFEHNNIIRKKILESVPSWETDKDKIGDLTYHYKEMKGTILHEEWILDKISQLPQDEREKYRDCKFNIIFYGTSVITRCITKLNENIFMVNEGRSIDIDKIKGF